MVGIVSQDPKNANRGTVRGDGMLERSLQQYGAGRSALADRNGVLIAGNKAVAKAQELGIPVQLIPSDGKTLYIIQRTDLDLLTDDQAKELAIADNRAGQLNLDWNPDVLQSFIDDGIDLEQFWDDGELAQVLANVSAVTGFDLDADTEQEQIGPDEDGDDIDQGSLLEIMDVTIAEPRHQVAYGDVWLLGKHVLICASVQLDHDLWTKHLVNGTMFCPYPGPLVPHTSHGDKSVLVMVQPSLYVAGHILDRFAELCGEELVRRG